MKKMTLSALCILMGLFLLSCSLKQGGGRGEDPGKKEEVPSGKTGPDAENFLDFYYTEENINYNAFYQRYRVYEEDGKHMFFHETRQVKDDYGPATEKHTTLKGCFALTEEEWQQFLDFLSGGSASPRPEDPEDGDSGPWLYLYQKDGDPEGEVFSFSSYGDLKAFEEWCRQLAEQGR